MSSDLAHLPDLDASWSHLPIVSLRKHATSASYGGFDEHLLAVHYFFSSIIEFTS